MTAGGKVKAWDGIGQRGESEAENVNEHVYKWGEIEGRGEGGGREKRRVCGGWQKVRGMTQSKKQRKHFFTFRVCERNFFKREFLKQTFYGVHKAIHNCSVSSMRPVWCTLYDFGH